VADLARKSRQKSQEEQSNGKTPAAKPRVFTDGDFASSGTAWPQATKPPAPKSPAGSGEKTPAAQGGSAPTPVKVNITGFSLEKPTIKRPGGSPVNWMIQNKSDHAVTVKATYTITGPCDYKWENSESVDLTQGQGYGDNMLAVAAFPESFCAGQYSLELRITSGSQIITSASVTATVQ
jgi:hypothetical protein